MYLTKFFCSLTIENELISDFIDTLEASQIVSPQLCVDEEEIDIVFTDTGEMTKTSPKLKDPYDSIDSHVKGKP
jgi:hypothetical protein